MRPHKQPIIIIYLSRAIKTLHVIGAAGPWTRPFFFF